MQAVKLQLGSHVMEYLVAIWKCLNEKLGKGSQRTQIIFPVYREVKFPASAPGTCAASQNVPPCHGVFFVSASDLKAIREKVCFQKWETNVLWQAKSRQASQTSLELLESRDNLPDPLWNSWHLEVAARDYYWYMRFEIGQDWTLDIGHTLSNCVRNLWILLWTYQKRHNINFLSNFIFLLDK